MRRNPSKGHVADRALALALAVLAALSLAGCAKKEEPAPAPVAGGPIVFEPLAAGSLAEREVGEAAEKAASIHPDLTPRPPEDVPAPPEAQPTPAPEPASAPSSEGS